MSGAEEFLDELDKTLAAYVRQINAAARADFRAGGDQYQRLDGKAQGVQLALSKVREWVNR